jgi:exopolysaccharide production protein ExoZ
MLRGLAALSIAVLHAPYDADGLAVRLGRDFTPFGPVPWAAGVDVFFVISGLIMVHASRSLFGRPGAQGLFLARRIARIVPLYWAVPTLYLATALAAAGLLNSAILEPWPILASYLFIPFERPDGAVQPLYSLGWTLNYEMFFYALFALALAWPSRRAVLKLMGLMVGLVALGRAVALPQPFAFWTDPIILEFVFGLGLGLLQAEGTRLSRPVRLAAVLAALAILCLNPLPPEVLGAFGRAAAWGFPAALLVAAAALGRERTRPATGALRWGATLGDASYALYLLHPFAIRAGSAAAVLTGFGALIGPWGYVAVVLAAAVALAVAVHRWFEQPMTDLARRRLEPVRSPQLSSPCPPLRAPSARRKRPHSASRPLPTPCRRAGDPGRRKSGAACRARRVVSRR